MWTRWWGAACAAIGFVLLLAQPSLPARAQSDVYQWTDEEGRIHFGDRPPDGAHDAAKVRKTPGEPLRPPLQRELQRTSSATSHVASVLSRQAFQDFELMRSGLSYRMQLPRD